MQFDLKLNLDYFCITRMPLSVCPRSHDAAPFPWEGLTVVQSPSLGEDSQHCTNPIALVRIS